MDKVKITNHQLFSLTACGAFGGVVLFVPSAITGIAQQDAWFSAVIAPIYGLLILKLFCSLGNQYPNMTFVEMIMQIFGKWIGWFIAASFFTYWSFILTNVVWHMGNFVNSLVMPETPPYVIIGTFILVIAIGVIYGLETIARSSELFLFFTSFFFILVMILNLSNVKIDNILPVFEKGITGSIKGSLILTDFMPLALLSILMIYPANVNDLRESEKSIYLGYLWSGFLIFLCILMNILVLGAPVTANAQFPTYLFAKQINIGNIFTRLEFLIASIWFTTFFIVSTLYFYSAVIGLSQLLGLKDYRKIVLPLGLIILVMTEINFPDEIYQINLSNLVLLPYDITYALILPIVLLFVSWVKKVYLNKRKV